MSHISALYRFLISPEKPLYCKLSRPPLIVCQERYQESRHHFHHFAKLSVVHSSLTTAIMTLLFRAIIVCFFCVKCPAYICKDNVKYQNFSSTQRRSNARTHLSLRSTSTSACTVHVVSFNPQYTSKTMSALRGDAWGLSS